MGSCNHIKAMVLLPSPSPGWPLRGPEVFHKVIILTVITLQFFKTGLHCSALAGL